MGQINYNIGVSTTQGVQALQSLQNQVEKTNSVFTKLGTAVAGLATASFISSIYQMADSLDDMAASTGVSTQAVLGFTSAVSANGGSMEGATQAIGKFVQKINDAAGGSKEAQDTFLKLGISLDDLRKLSEEDLLKKAVAGFNEGKTASEKLALAVSLFGKEARAWDMSKINSQLSEYIAKSKDSASAVTAAAEANQNFENAFKEFKLQLLSALEPLSKLAVVVLENKQVIGAFISTIVNLAAVFVGMKVIKTAVGWLGEFGLAIKEGKSLMSSFGSAAGLTTGLDLFQSGLKKIKYEFIEMPTMFAKLSGGDLFKGAVNSLGAMMAGFGRMLPLIGQILSVFMVLNGVIEAMSGKSIVGWAKEGLQAVGLMSKETKNAANAAGEQADNQRQVTDAIAATVQALQNQLNAYKDTNQEQLKKLQMDTEALGLSEEQKALVEELHTAEKAYLGEMSKLREDYIAKSQSGSESDLRALPQISAAMGEITSEYESQIAALKVANELKFKAVDAARLEAFANKQVADMTQKVRDLQDEMAMGTMNELQRKYYQIEVAARNTAEAELERLAITKNITREQISEETVKKYYDAAYAGVNKLKQVTRDQYNEQRSFATGWKKAFNEYVDAATNAANQAERIFNKFTQGLEDMLVDFVKTGKLNWKDFVSSMAEELLRSQLKSTIADIFSLLSGGTASGGLLGGLLGGLFGGGGGISGGQGASPTNPLYVLDISGGGGTGGLSSLLSGGTGAAGGTGILGTLGGMLGGAWDTVKGWFGGSSESTSSGSSGFSLSGLGEAVGNVWGGVSTALGSLGESVGSGLSGIASGISQVFGGSGGGLGDIFQSVGDLFSGWFANGGTLGAGRWGIAGENGPEVVSGPATITPLTGGTTNVNYYISAVDAMSFKQMIAADPTFLYAVTMQGAKSIPGGR